MSIQPSSPVAVRARQGIDNASRTLEDVSIKFATGRNFARPSEDLFGSIEAATGNSTMLYTKSALSNLTRLRSMLATRNGALETMRDGAQVLSDIALQASGVLPDDVRSANVNVFNQVMDRVSDIAKTADYGGIRLLDGTFGGAGDFETANNVHNVAAYSADASDAGVIDGMSVLQNQINRASISVTIEDNDEINDGDTLTVNGETFTFKSDEATSANDILIGKSAHETVKNAVDKLNRSESESLKKFGFELTGGDTVKVTDLSLGDRTAGDLGDLVTTSLALGQAYSVETDIAENSVANLSHAENVNILGKLGKTISLSSFEIEGEGDHALEEKLDVYYRAATGTRTSDEDGTDLEETHRGWDLGGDEIGDTNHHSLLTKFEIEIGGEKYNAYHISRATDTGGDVTDQLSEAVAEGSLYVVKASDDIDLDAGDIDENGKRDAEANKLDGKVFIINLQEAADINRDEMGGAHLNLLADNTTATFDTDILNTLQGLFESDADKISFKQDRHMEVSTDGGDITVNNVAIGSVNGLTARLKSDNFDNLQVTNVAFNEDGINVTMDQNGVSEQKVFTADFAKSFAAGSNIKLTHEESGDELTLTLGASRDLDLSTEANRRAASTEFSRALGSSESSTFIVGTDVSQRLVLDLGDMSWNKLAGGKNLSINTQAEAQDATSVLSDIVDKLNAEIGTTAAFDKSVDSLVQQMEVSQQNLSAAVDGLQSLNIPQAREQLDRALQGYSAGISAITADQRANQTLQQLLQI